MDLEEPKIIHLKICFLFKFYFILNVCVCVLIYVHRNAGAPQRSEKGIAFLGAGVVAGSVPWLEIPFKA